MLNTDLHNPSIKEDRRMTAESLRNNRGIAAEGGDLPDEVLIGYLIESRKLPFSLKEDDVQGWGQKQMFEAAISSKALLFSWN
jgi:brefeldin A-inhibited guanine nucleotide-exchange protein